MGTALPYNAQVRIAFLATSPLRVLGKVLGKAQRTVGRKVKPAAAGAKPGVDCRAANNLHGSPDGLRPKPDGQRNPEQSRDQSLGDLSVDVRYRTDQHCRTGARFDGGLMGTTLPSDHHEARATDGSHQSDAFVPCTGPLGRAGLGTGFGTNPRQQLGDAGIQSAGHVYDDGRCQVSIAACISDHGLLNDIGSGGPPPSHSCRPVVGQNPRLCGWAAF